MRAFNRIVVSAYAVSVILMLSMSEKVAAFDSIYTAIEYKCDLGKKELTLTAKTTEADIPHGSPFDLNDWELSGTYPSDSLGEPIVKKCPLGGIPLTVAIIPGCWNGGDSTASVAVYRDEKFSYTYDGPSGYKSFKSDSKPFVRVDHFDATCAPTDAARGMVFSKIIIKLVKSDPQQFSVVMK